jgi:hypothetical protein
MSTCNVIDVFSNSEGDRWSVFRNKSLGTEDRMSLFFKIMINLHQNVSLIKY